MECILLKQPQLIEIFKNEKRYVILVKYFKKSQKTPLGLDPRGVFLYQIHGLRRSQLPGFLGDFI
jgi:hypothetical protein